LEGDSKMARRRYEAPIRKTSTFGLNITSLTDMFTMLLVFLLQSYSTSEVQIEPPKDLRLPTSISESNPVDAVQLTLTKSELRLDKSIIARLNSESFNKTDLEEHDSSFIKPLFTTLNEMSKDPNSKPFIKEGKVLLHADAALPYATIRKVMYTASMAGFPQLKFVTVVGD